MPSHRRTSAQDVLRALALRALVLPALAWCVPHAAIAAESDPAPAPPAHIALKADRVLDVTHGTLRKQACVLIEGNKIVGIVDTPTPGYVVRDLGDVTLLPGLIDAHTHLMASADDGYEHMLLTMSQARRALEGAGNARKTLMAGFTTVRDVENEGSGYADVDLRDAIEAGVVEGPRMRVATRAIAAVGQYFPFGISPDLVNFPQGAQMVSGVDEARRAVREQIGHGADLIKVYADWSFPTLEPDELRAIVEEAHKEGRRVAAHATTPQGIANAVKAGVDSIEHAFNADKASLQLMREHDTWFVPTLGPFANGVARLPPGEERTKAQQRLDGLYANLRYAKQLGIRIGAGYDPGERALHGTNARELIAMGEAGLTNAEVLRAATLSNATLMGMDDRIGSIDAGKLADLVAVRGNPLDDLHALQQIVFVMKDGAIVRDDARH